MYEPGVTKNRAGSRLPGLPRLRMQWSFWLCLCALALQSFGCSGTSETRPASLDPAARLPLRATLLGLPSDAPGKVRVNFIAEVRYIDIQFLRQKGRFRAEVQLTFSLRDKVNRRNVFIRDVDRKIELTEFRQSVDRNGFVRFSESFDVDPGEYVAQINAADNFASTRGQQSREVKITDIETTFSISNPLLVTDSLASFSIDNLIPFHQRNFEEDFYAAVVLGGLRTDAPANLVYSLEGSEGTRLLERTLRITPYRPSIYLSLPIPSEKLALGTTLLRVFIEQGGNRANTQLRIAASFGNTLSGNRNFDSLIGPMRYLMQKDAYDTFVNASRAEQAEILQSYWRARDPDPKDDENPLLEEFYSRVEIANARFGWEKRAGYSTDRGRIFIVYGPPDSLEGTNRVGANSNYEVWVYESLGLRFVFVDKHNDGNFQLLTSSGLR